MKRLSFILGKSIAILSGILIFGGLYLASLHSYLLFHCLAEIFGIIIACGVFMLAWNARRFLDNNYLLFLGIAYLFVGGLDLIHAMVYKGMGILAGYDANLPTQLWIAARCVQSLSLLAAPLFLRRKLKPYLVFFVYTALTLLLVGAIFYESVFPDCYVEGAGLTSFKKISEYVISLVLLASIAMLLRNRREFSRDVLRLLVSSIVVTIASELSFTFYVSVYGFPNLLGHFFKIVAFYLIYKAIIETGLVKPYGLLFRNLKQSEEALRESEARYRAVVEGQTELICRFLPDGTLTFVNDAYCRYFGRRREELIGQSFVPFIPPEDQERVKKTIASLNRENPMTTHEHRVVSPGGEIRWHQWTNRAIFDEQGRLVEFQAVGRDTTERKQAEEALHQRTVELQARNEELDAFAHTVAHDLKNPLSVIIGFVEVLREDDALIPAEERRKYLHNIERIGRKMDDITEALLLLAQVPQMEVEMEPLDMAHVVNETLLHLGRMIEEQQAEIVLPDAWPEALGYGPWVEEVWFNYLSNAMRYGGRPPRVELGATAQPDGRVRFWVRDNGDGLTPEAQARLFTPFTRLDETRAMGHGLGLSIVRRIVEKLDGQAGVESKVGQGSTFTFTLRAAQSGQGHDSGEA
jgi:PAS domain S-box-containing protein